ncbi:SMU1112c/YaeR family gloxylase I-like metalloprotein [Sediminibacterium soli]|uniref:SMU1112c/YaeR family gloxylase I-like metalloprotein n=1 Tax=Sediminibacterium soli TaxID=2698829 RepID=UPI00137ADBE3|nr:VOC family protein [Sediminibacterium soli]NCI46489.1 VOC family protein [Sediminibacterium soli]
MIQITGIHHVAILTDNGLYAASKQFYTSVLGFTVICETFREERNSYKLDLALNGIYQLELFSFPDYRERASYPEAKGLRHLAFAVADIRKGYEWLRQNKVRVEAVRTDELTGKQFVFFYDPNGQPLELYEA